MWALPVIISQILVSIPVSGVPNWTTWSPWSACSRTCDGGASYKIRRCEGGKCPGESIRYKICNNEPCPVGSMDFRTQQCRAYNDVAYNGVLHEWIPEIDEKHACSLRCKPKDGGFGVILAPKVLDGTRCGNRNQDMCINGKCYNIGCNGELGSNKTVDACGVCGGNDRTCAQNNIRYVWTWADHGGCSVTCGVGIRTEKPVCRDTRNDRMVADSYCLSRSPRPQHRKSECRLASCHPVWITKDWQPCSKSCGGGISRRHVYCVLLLADGSFMRAHAVKCPDAKPVNWRRCNQSPCPKWFAGKWSPCSVTCGEGTQHRDVICKKAAGQMCDVTNQPTTKRVCQSVMPCLSDVAESGSDGKVVVKNRTGSVTEKRQNPVISKVSFARLRANKTILTRHLDESSVTTGHHIRSSHHIRHPKSKGIQFFRRSEVVYFRPELQEHKLYPWRPHVTARPSTKSNHIGSTYLNTVTNAPEMNKGNSENELHDTENRIEGTEYSDFQTWPPILPDPKPPWYGSEEDKVDSHSSEDKHTETPNVPGKPRYLASRWSACSATCGVGIRHRMVRCRIFLKFHKSFQVLPDSECSGPRPPEVEPCHMGPCPYQETTYIWESFGYSPCSVTCGGGVQLAIIKCLRQVDNREVDGIYCGAPPNYGMTRRCAQDACQPSWSIGPLGLCSHPCAGGHQRSLVKCVQRVSEKKTRVLPDHHCQPPRPYNGHLCNPQDCDPNWVPQEWSECSVTCGRGSQKRSIQCQQLVYPLKLRILNNTQCPGTPPETVRACLQAPCPANFSQQPEGLVLKYVQLKTRKRVTVNNAKVVYIIPGTSLLLRCPHRGNELEKVRWFKKNRHLRRGRRIKTSKAGSLRIHKAKLRDAGNYTCKTSSGSMTMILKFVSREESKQLLKMRLHLIPKPARREKPGNTSLSFQRDQYASTSNEIIQLNYNYVPEAWSACSRTCGGAGLQLRGMNCEMVRRDSFIVVPDNVCSRLKRKKPGIIQQCGIPECPDWWTGNWTQCLASHCSGLETSVRKRELHCRLQNGTNMAESLCNPDTRPIHRKPCNQPECTPIWKTSSWSKCSTSCGKSGVRTRMLQCVWASSKQPAGLACKGLPRPPVKRSCKPPSCDTIGCHDNSRYCSLIPRLRMCKYQSFRIKCCESCEKNKMWLVS